MSYDNIQAASAASSRSAPSDKSACGSEGQTCFFCRKAVRDTRASVSNALRLIRIRFGIPYSELPDLKVEELDRYLKFLLLEGQERPSIAFPRRQKERKSDAEGCLPLERLWRKERWELAHSVASIKRNLPAGCPVHKVSQLDTWRRRATTPSPPSSAEYLAFVRKTVRRLFPFGWDSKYEDFVWSFVPKPSARLKKRSRADHLLRDRGGGIEFRRNVLAGKGFDTSELRARYKEVLSAGKVRPLVIFDDRVDLLGPLHHTIYRWLARGKWLLVGPPTEKRVSSVCSKTFQTSVDLVAATDNLSITVASTILECLLARAARVPGEIRLLAVNSLPCIVNCAGEEVQVSHGQMMGGYLSFPLLCLQSYIAAAWATRQTEAEILVNGDDTLISSDRPVRSEDYPPGFFLNDKKTIRSKGVAEINSTCFLKDGRGRWRQVHHLRRGSFLPDFPGMLHAAAAVRSSVKWTDAFIRSRIGKIWGLSPRQLRLHPQSYVAFQRQRELRRRRVDTPLPSAAQAAQEGLVAVRGQPDPDEVIALSEWLRNHGRPGGGLRDVWQPTVGCIRRTFRYLRSAPRVMLTFKSTLATLRFLKDREGELYFVPAEYEARRVTEGSRELEAWKQALRDSADAA